MSDHAGNPMHPVAEQGAWVIVTAVACVVMAGCLVFYPPALVGIAAVLAFLALIGSRTFRQVWTLFVPLLALQGDSTVLKLGYASGLAVVFLCSASEIRAEFAASIRYRRAAMAAVTMLVFLLVAGPIQAAGSLSLQGARESLNYVMLAFVPLLAPALRLPNDRLQGFIIGSLTLCAAGMYFWSSLDRRAVNGVDQSQAGFASLALVACCAACMFAAQPRRVGGKSLTNLAVGLFAIVISIASGTRSALSLVVLPVVATWRAWVRARHSSSPFSLGRLVLVAVPILGAVWWISKRAVGESNYYVDRYQSVLNAISGRASIFADQSAQLREVHYELALSMFHRYTFAGTGTGYEYHVFTGQKFLTSSQLDTPLITLARIGLFGTAILIAVFACWISYLIMDRGRAERTGAVSVGVSIVIWMIVQLPAGSALEDKGLGLGILVAVLSTRRPLSLSGAQESGLRRQER